MEPSVCAADFCVKGGTPYIFVVVLCSILVSGGLSLDGRRSFTTKFSIFLLYGLRRLVEIQNTILIKHKISHQKYG